MLNFKKIFLTSSCLMIINMQGSTQDDNSPLSQAAFLLAKKQAGRQVAHEVLLDLRSEETIEHPRQNARKTYHRKKRIRAQQITERVRQALVQIQDQQNRFSSMRRRVDICNMRLS